jgi:hypothetical protein
MMKYSKLEVVFFVRRQSARGEAHFTPRIPISVLISWPNAVRRMAFLLPRCNGIEASVNLTR